MNKSICRYVFELCANARCFSPSTSVSLSFTDSYVTFYTVR